MIFKRLIERIHLNHHHQNSSNSSNTLDDNTPSQIKSYSKNERKSRLVSDRTKKRNSDSDFKTLTPALGNRSASSGNALCSVNNKPKIFTNKKLQFSNSLDLETEMMTFTGTHDYHKDPHDLKSSDDLNLHHDHNTYQLFRHMNHFSKVLRKLNDMRNNEQMCDVTFITDGEMIMCHKYVLSANSPYFLAMFTNGLIETNKRIIEIKEVDVNSLRLLVDFMYTGEISITELNVQNLLSTANLLQLNSVKEACSQFIQSQLDLSNCLGIREFAEAHFCPVLFKHAEAFIEQYYSDIVLNEEFYNLNKDQLIKLISKDHISVNSEMVIFKSVIRWMSIDMENRKNDLIDILKHVRFPLMEEEELHEIISFSLVKDNSNIKDIIVKALELKCYTPVSDDNTSNLNLAFIRPRVSLGLPRSMLLFGGQAPKATNKVETYDFRLQKWQSLREMPNKRSRAGCIKHGKLIYLIGGFNGQSRTRTVDIYNFEKDEWDGGISMLCRRGTLGVGYLQGKLYAIGGYDGMSGLMSAECYDPAIKIWKMIANMSIRRSSLGIATLGNYIFAIGGYCGMNRECLDSVERYDPLTDTWKLVAKMKRRRSGAAVNVYDNKIYVAGGHDGPVIHNSVEVYDMDTNKWSLIAEMNTCRRNAGFIINNGLFYVLGGDDGINNLSSVEVFNIQRNVWSFMPNYLPEARSYISCVVIDNHT